MLCPTAIVTWALIVAPPANARLSTKACFETQEAYEQQRDE